MKQISSWINLLVAGAFLCVCGLLVYQVFALGWPQLTQEFLFSDVESAGRKGGIWPVLINTVVIVGLSGLLTVFIGIPVGFYLSDSRSQRKHFARLTSFSLDTLASTPSIVFGLVGYIVFSRLFGFGYSLLSGVLTMTMMCLPFFIRITEVGLSILPKEMGQSAEALGISTFRYFFSVVVPLGMPVFATAFTLALGRGFAETAALIFTSGYATRMPESLLDSGRTLSVHILDLAMNVSGADKMAYASAVILLLISFTFNLSARVAMRWWQLNRQV